MAQVSLKMREVAYDSEAFLCIEKCFIIEFIFADYL